MENYKHIAAIIKDGVLQIQANLQSEPLREYDEKGDSFHFRLEQWQSQYKYIPFASKEDEVNTYNYALEHNTWEGNFKQNVERGIKVDCIEIKDILINDSHGRVIVKRACFKQPNEAPIKFISGIEITNKVVENQDKDNIIKWIAQRIKDEKRKHSANDDNWHEIAARKIYATYLISLSNDALLNSFGNYCVINGIKLTDSNKVGQAVIDFLKSEYYLNNLK